MKKLKFIGYLSNYERLNCSVYGNPAFRACFVNGDGYIIGRTASNASCAYGFLNYPEKKREIEYHITKKGNIIIDYITIL